MKESLADMFPEITVEWEREKNAPLVPEHVSPKSQKKVWWKCKNGHSWEQKINLRVECKGVGCPYCGGRKVWKGFNDLATLHPELAEEWDGTANGNWKPSDFLSNSHENVHWICKRGHHWEAKIFERVGGKNCTICSGRKIVAGINDFASVNPDLCADWDYDCKTNPDPTAVSPSNGRQVQWKCHICGYIWNERIQDRVRRRTPCAKCEKKILISGVNDLYSQYPEIAAEWDAVANGDTTPSAVKYNARTRAHWKCARGHTWTARIFDRIYHKTGCPYCNGQRVIPGETDLRSRYPELAAQWDERRNGDLTPDQIPSHFNQKVWWKCGRCGEAWQESPDVRISKRTGCPYCAGSQAIPSKTSFAAQYPELLPEWDYDENRKNGIDPDRIMPKSNRSVGWRCEKGHKWNATVKSRTLMKSGCPYCSGRLPVVGENDLATCYPYLMSEWDYDKNELGPENYTTHSGREVYWRCENGHSWKAKICYRVMGKKGCLQCRRKGKYNTEK